MTGDNVIYGDPHGEWRPLLRACQEDRPDGVVLLGDCDLDLPLRQRLGRLFDAGIRVLWIPGNHDADTEEFHDRLWGDHPEGNVHAGWARVGSLTVVSLGAVFKGRVWYPRSAAADPLHASRQDFMRRLPRTSRWRDGLPRDMRDAISPEDAAALGKLRAEVLVTHEAPTTHRHGFAGIDGAARLCGARLVVHGHHHESYVSALPDGTPVRSLARAEVFRVSRETLG